MLIPILAMQFTDDIKWALFDFIIAGILLLGTGLTCELIIRMVKKRNYRIVLYLILMIIFFLIFAELAVGILGTPLSGN